MLTIFLSGVGGSTNWLPLIFPLAALAAVAWSIDATAKYRKRRRLKRENQLIDTLMLPGDQPAEPQQNA
jgi:hypothetical protein